MSARDSAHAALMDTLQAHAASGHLVPCLKYDSDAWTSDSPAEQRTVADLCQYCPALAECSNYLTRYGERAGVWAGTTTADRYANTGKPKPKEQP